MRTLISVAVRWACVTMALAMLVAAPAEAASVRLVHAVTGGGPVSATAGSGGAAESLGEAIEFGEVTPYREVAGGRVQISLRSADGEEEVSVTDEPLTGDRRYTAVALGRERNVKLRVYTDEPAEGGVAKLRFIQVTPELGDAELRVGDTVVARDLPYPEASPYRSVEPGTYTLAAGRPGGNEEPLVEEADVSLRAGTASTALLMGSAGERIRFVVVDDETAAPSVAPGTGFGGLSDSGAGVSWLAIVAAALAAGALGGLARWRLAAAGRTRSPRGG